MSIPNMKKKNYTLIELIVTIMIIGGFLLTGAILIAGCIFGYRAYNAVKDEGMKPALEQVWEGPEKPLEAPQETSPKEVDINE
jgi:hypothetical protein